MRLKVSYVFFSCWVVSAMPFFTSKLQVRKSFCIDMISKLKKKTTAYKEHLVSDKTIDLLQENEVLLRHNGNVAFSHSSEMSDDAVEEDEMPPFMVTIPKEKLKRRVQNPFLLSNARVYINRGTERF